jgi:hypothetical protein
MSRAIPAARMREPRERRIARVRQNGINQKERIIAIMRSISDCEFIARRLVAGSRRSGD